MSLIDVQPPVKSAAGADRSAAKIIASGFCWAAGIETSNIPHLNVDQIAWTQHDRFWKDDFRRAREELGCTHLRYAFPWHSIEPQRGTFDFAKADERVAEAKRIGLELMLDVMHFGTPLWLKQAVGDPEFPEAIESYTRALVERYAGSINIWCPFNEPLVSALFSGDFGFWPPHARKWRGYMPVLSRIVQGVSRSIRAIRRAAPQATVLLCDAAEHFASRDPSLQVEIQRRNLRRYIAIDLLTGRVDRNHPLHEWVSAYGINDQDLEWFRSNPQRPDVLGLDYYPHSDWALERRGEDAIRQRRADKPFGFYNLANLYWQRYGIPMMLTETSIEGEPINREIWLDTVLDDIRRLREGGTPLLGVVWWPLVDHLDWDGALTHRVGKIHEVGLYHLKRQPDGTLARVASSIAKLYRESIAQGEERIGKLAEISTPTWDSAEDQLPPVAEWSESTKPVARTTPHHNGNGNRNGKSSPADPAPGLAAEPSVRVKKRMDTSPTETASSSDPTSTDRFGIVVFSHLRWGFVWQRPQQFLSRFARKHPILFIEEPMFDVAEGNQPRVEMHAVMPNVTVACPHAPQSMSKSRQMPSLLRKWTAEAIERVNENSAAFDQPLLWYYSPMDSAWSLGHFENRGVVYDCMDELSQFTGAPKQLIAHEARLMEHADIVFTGGYELGDKKRKQHGNVHVFGCGVEFDHFNKAQDPTTVIPPDIDFMARPILGWMGVVDERVDYHMVGQMARLRPDWSFAMVGPVVKVDPNLLPHAPNLFWLGGRDYKQLPNYCAAFDVNMMCFALNASTEFINPTKGLEYMATGKPIVSTRVRDVVRQWSDIVHLASGAEEFIAQAEAALKDPRGERVQRGLELAKQNSWDATVNKMRGLIRDAIGKPNQKRDITPLSEVELEYFYQPTQGS